MKETNKLPKILKGSISTTRLKIDQLRALERISKEEGFVSAELIFIRRPYIDNPFRDYHEYYIDLVFDIDKTPKAIVKKYNLRSVIGTTFK